MASLPCRRDRGAQLAFLLIDVAEDKMRRPGGEKLNDLRGTNVSAMQHHGRLQAFQHAHRGACRPKLPMGIAHDADQHVGTLSRCGRGKERLYTLAFGEKPASDRRARKPPDASSVGLPCVTLLVLPPGSVTCGPTMLSPELTDGL